MIRRYIPYFTFSLVNGIVMLLLALLWISLPRTFGDEAFFIKWTSLIKKSLLGFDDKPAPEDILYVDVAGSKTLVEIADPLYQEKTGFQHTAITDRRQLAGFLQQIATYGERIPLIVLDISFTRASPDDSLLQAAIDSLSVPIVGAQELDENGWPIANVIQLPTGIANYLSPDNSFLKYPLYLQDSLPTLPLVAYGTLSDQSFSRPGIWPRIAGAPNLINPIIDFKIRPGDLNDGTQSHLEGYPIRSLGTLLFEWEFWEESDIRLLLENKIIFIGDFQSDRHETVFGQIPGTVIVHNTMLTLKNGESRIRTGWILLLFGLFFWMSWRQFREAKTGQRTRWWKAGNTAVGQILADSIDESFYLILGTILSFFLFNIHINILILLIYLKVITFILQRFAFRPSPSPTTAS
jgi:hypothetical protein